MTISKVLACSALALALAFAGPSMAKSTHNNSISVHSSGVMGGLGLSAQECKDAGGRVVANASCYGGKQCRGIENQECISAK